MKLKDPKLIALYFNDYINNQDINGLSNLMTEDHTFIDRKGEIDKGKKSMTEGWIDFFKQFPNYKNVFSRVESQGNVVTLLGHAKWSKDSANDHAIWTALIEDGLVAEWRIYADTVENRKKFNLISK